MKTTTKTQSGFTLIELMVVVAIVAILAAIGYPSYTQYLVRANRSAAQQFMLDIANREEQYLLDARVYTNTLGTGGLNLTTPPDVDRYYTITVTGEPSTYTITATPKVGTSQAGDGNLTLTNTGAKSPADKWK